MEGVVDLLADAARVANGWTLVMHWFGRKFTQFGAWLSADMRKAQQIRLDRTKNAFVHLKKAKGVK